MKKGRHHKSDYQKEAAKAAKELLYGFKVISMIRNAKSDEEIRRIMCDARNGKIK